MCVCVIVLCIDKVGAKVSSSWQPGSYGVTHLPHSTSYSIQWDSEGVDLPIFSCFLSPKYLNHLRGNRNCLVGVWPREGESSCVPVYIFLLV